MQYKIGMILLLGTMVLFGDDSRLQAQATIPSKPYEVINRNKKTIKQRPSRATGEKKLSSTISFEILTPPGGASRAARRWYSEFEKLQIPLRIHQGIAGDQIKVTESVRGRVRRVTVIAQLGRNGELILPGRKFTTGNVEQLRTWIDELSTYGAQGSPEGQKLWGLTEEQFHALFKALEKPMAGSVLGKNFVQGLEQFEFPKEFPIMIELETKTFLTSSLIPDEKQTQELTGLSRGAAFTIFLRQYGLCFVPSRLPSKRIVLSIQLLVKAEDPWPVGWDWGDSYGRVAPNFHRSNKDNPVRRAEHSIVKLSELVTKRSGMPIYFDESALKAVGFDVSREKVKVRPRVTTWNLLFSKGLAKAHLRFERRLDEQGQPFLWVVPDTYLLRHPILKEDKKTNSPTKK